MMDLLARPSKLKFFDDFLYTPAYLVLVGILTVLANIAGAELITYTCFILIALYLCLFGRDFLPIIPLVICSYIAPSRSNNPGINTDSVFSAAGGGIYLVVLAVLLVIGVVYRLICDPDFGGKAFLHCKRKLLPGILVLGGAYLLSGLGTEQWSQIGPQNVLFAAIQFLSIVLPYLILTGAVHWEKAPTGYLAWTGVCVGYVLLTELAFIYLQQPIIQDGAINRPEIYTGWGHYNNIGALLAMMIPSAFFLTGKGKHTSVFYISGLLFLGGILFTCSRTSFVCGVLAYLASYTISLFHSRQARANAVIHVCTALAGVAVFILYADNLLWLFRDLLDQKMDFSLRYEGYLAGWKQFLDYPILGGTFFPVDYPLYSWSTSQEFIAFFPPRWHNTVVQLLASCGIVGLLAYGFHRFQTLQLFFRQPTGKKMFALVSILTLLAASMLDCHFFNVGPTLFYSMLLAFVEKKLD